LRTITLSVGNDMEWDANPSFIEDYLTWEATGIGDPPLDIHGYYVVVCPD
jgi:hypothetical protein